MKRVLPNALSWGRSHQLGDQPIPPLDFLRSCFPDYCQLYCPSGVDTSVPAGGLNSNVDGGIGARVGFE